MAAILMLKSHSDVIIVAMATNLLSGTRILLDMLTLRLCGYTSNNEQMLIK